MGTLLERGLKNTKEMTRDEGIKKDQECAD